MGFPFHGKISVGECVVTLKSSLPVFSKKVTPLSVLNSRPQHIFRPASADYRELHEKIPVSCIPFLSFEIIRGEEVCLGRGAPVKP